MNAQMSVEVVLLVEQPIADVTLVGLFASVGSNVSFKIIRLNKLLATVRAVEGFRGGVHQRVPGKFLLIWEGTRTEGTLEGILEDMGFHVSFEIVRLGKGFLADLAFVGLNLVVLLHVIGQFLGVEEHFVTHGANVRLLIRITNSDMFGQLCWMKELGPANLTNERVGAHMSGKIIFLVEPFLTDGTSVRAFIRVSPDVRLQVIRLAKMLTTNLAFVRFLSRMNLHVSGQVVGLNETFSTNSTGVRLLSAVFA